MDNTNKIVDFFFEIATLRRLTRSHRQVIENVSDNIADHSFRVAIIGMILANLEKCDENKVLKMCLFHDIAEARTGDANHINKKYTDMNNFSAYKDQFFELPIENSVLDLLNEYENRSSRESVVAKDADIIDQMILQQEYFFKDDINRNLWQEYAQKNLKTNSAKQLSVEIKKSNPLNWLYKVINNS